MSKDENKDNNLTEKIIHSVLTPILYVPALILLLIYLFAMNLEKLLFIDKKLPYCKKKFGVWKSYNINYKDYYQKINPWSFLNIIFNEDKACSGSSNFVTYYLGKYYYNMTLLPSNKLHDFLKNWLRPNDETVSSLKSLLKKQKIIDPKTGKSTNPNYSAKDIFSNIGFGKLFLLNNLVMVFGIPFVLLFVSLFYNFFSAINNIESFGVLMLMILAFLLCAIHVIGHFIMYVYWLLTGYNNNVYKLMKASVHKENWRNNYLFLFLLLVIIIEGSIWIK